MFNIGRLNVLQRIVNTAFLDFHIVITQLKDAILVANVSNVILVVFMIMEYFSLQSFLLFVDSHELLQ